MLLEINEKSFVNGVKKKGLNLPDTCCTKMIWDIRQGYVVRQCLSINIFIDQGLICWENRQKSSVQGSSEKVWGISMGKSIQVPKLREVQDGTLGLRGKNGLESGNM